MMVDTPTAEYFFFPVFKHKRSSSISSIILFTPFLDMLRPPITTTESLTRFPPFAEPQPPCSGTETPMYQGLRTLFRSSAAGSAIINRDVDTTDAGNGGHNLLRHRASEASNTSAGTNISRWRWPLRRTNTNASNLADVNEAVGTRDFEAVGRAKLDDFIDELDHTFLTADDRKMLRKIERLYRTTVRHHPSESSHSREESSRAESDHAQLARHAAEDHAHESRGRPFAPQSTAGQAVLLSPQSTTLAMPRSSASLPVLHLRGGGRRTTLPSPPPRTRFPDDARVDAATWWFAGGRKSRHGRVPTVGELRVRKEVEQANRARVGFFGTLLGVRKIGRVVLKGEEIAEAEAAVDELMGTAKRKDGGSDDGKSAEAANEAHSAHSSHGSHRGSTPAPESGSKRSQQRRDGALENKAASKAHSAHSSRGSHRGSTPAPESGSKRSQQRRDSALEDEAASKAHSVHSSHGSHRGSAPAPESGSKRSQRRQDSALEDEAAGKAHSVHSSHGSHRGSAPAPENGSKRS